MIAAIVVAAGKGLRMGGRQPKQYLPLDNQPIIVHTLKAFIHCALIETVVLVAPEKDHEFCRHHILTCLETDTVLVLASGGIRRQQSVYNGLCKVDGKPEDIVLIHDGVRPLVSEQLINACIQGAREHGACIPVLPTSDTLKQVDDSGVIVRTVPRDRVCMAQTPQAFKMELIKSAHETARQKGWDATDDASLLERMGVPVHTIAGSYKNIKVTTPKDLIVCRALMADRTGAA